MLHVISIVINIPARVCEGKWLYVSKCKPTGEFSLESKQMIFSPVHQSSSVIVDYRNAVWLWNCMQSELNIKFITYHMWWDFQTRLHHSGRFSHWWLYLVHTHCSHHRRNKPWSQEWCQCNKLLWMHWACCLSVQHSQHFQWHNFDIEQQHPVN